MGKALIILSLLFAAAHSLASPITEMTDRELYEAYQMGDIDALSILVFNKYSINKEQSIRLYNILKTELKSSSDNQYRWIKKDTDIESFIEWVSLLISEDEKIRNYAPNPDHKNNVKIHCVNPTKNECFKIFQTIERYSVKLKLDALNKEYVISSTDIDYSKPLQKVNSYEIYEHILKLGSLKRKYSSINGSGIIITANSIIKEVALDAKSTLNTLRSIASGIN